MGTKAYFMINMDKKFSDDSYYLDAIRELEAIPEVESVNPVSGVCDLLVKVDAPIRVILVANTGQRNGSKTSTSSTSSPLNLLKLQNPLSENL